jgi:hypothetical protein
MLHSDFGSNSRCKHREFGVANQIHGVYDAANHELSCETDADVGHEFPEEAEIYATTLRRTDLIIPINRFDTETHI